MLYRATINKEMVYRHYRSDEQAVNGFRIIAIKRYGNLTDIQKKLKNGSYSRIPFSLNNGCAKQHVYQTNGEQHGTSDRAGKTNIMLFNPVRDVMVNPNMVNDGGSNPASFYIT